MKMIGNEVYIQRGENWSLDFAVTNDKGHPYVVLKTWENPYLAITVAAALYEQKGDYRETYWLDLNRRWVEQQNGSVVLEPLKKFISSEVLPLNIFAISEALSVYGVYVGGKMVLDKTNDFDVTNYLFFVDVYNDGNYTYKYVKDYTLDGYGYIVDEEWEDYDFRVIKQFDTKSWMEQGYLFDIKVLAGESVQEHIAGILDVERTSYKSDFDTWTNEDWENYIAAIKDETLRAEMQALYDDGAPLMPSFDTKSLLLEPTPIYVSVNIQGGIK